MFLSLCFCIWSRVHSKRKRLSLSDFHNSLTVIISSPFFSTKMTSLLCFYKELKLYAIFHIAFTRSSLKAHQDWFHNLAVVNTASASGMCWVVITQEQTGSYNRPDFVSLGNCAWISTAVRLVYMPSSRVEVFPCLSVLSSTCCYSFLNACPSGYSEWNLCVVLICISLVTSDLIPDSESFCLCIFTV